MAGDGGVTDVGTPVVHIHAIAAVTRYAGIDDNDTRIVTDLQAIVSVAADCSAALQKAARLPVDVDAALAVVTNLYTEGSYAACQPYH